MLVVPVVLGLASCAEDIDEEYSPALVVDDKKYDADQFKDTSYRPGDDFFMYCNGGFHLADSISVHRGTDCAS